jgi:C1A family cysteine protease
MEALGGGVSDAVENDLTQNTLVRIENADIDLRSFDTEIKNQGGTSLCSSFAAIAALEHSINRKYHKKIDLSEMDLFYHYGRYDAQMAVDAASSFWLMDEASWPFYLSGPISSSAPGIARITSASGVLTKVSSIIESLRQNYPVIMAITITQPMLLEGGVINRYGWRQNLGHAMVAVGAFFDDRLVNEGGGVLILKNSWGATQGDKGYAYLPLNYCDANAGFQCWAWAVKDVEFMK